MKLLSKKDKWNMGKIQEEKELNSLEDIRVPIRNHF